MDEGESISYILPNMAEQHLQSSLGMLGVVQSLIKERMDCELQHARNLQMFVDKHRFLLSNEVSMNKTLKKTLAVLVEEASVTALQCKTVYDNASNTDGPISQIQREESSLKERSKQGGSISSSLLHYRHNVDRHKHLIDRIKQSQKKYEKVVLAICNIQQRLKKRRDRARERPEDKKILRHLQDKLMMAEEEVSSAKQTVEEISRNEQVQRDEFVSDVTQFSSSFLEEEECRLGCILDSLVEFVELLKQDGKESNGNGRNRLLKETWNNLQNIDVKMEIGHWEKHSSKVMNIPQIKDYDLDDEELLYTLRKHLPCEATDSDVESDVEVIDISSSFNSFVTQSVHKKPRTSLKTKSKRVQKAGEPKATNSAPGGEKFIQLKSQTKTKVYGTRSEMVNVKSKHKQKLVGLADDKQNDDVDDNWVSTSGESDCDDDGDGNEDPQMSIATSGSPNTQKNSFVRNLKSDFRPSSEWLKQNGNEVSTKTKRDIERPFEVKMAWNGSNCTVADVPVAAHKQERIVDGYDADIMAQIRQVHIDNACTRGPAIRITTPPRAKHLSNDVVRPFQFDEPGDPGASKERHTYRDEPVVVRKQVSEISDDNPSLYIPGGCLDSTNKQEIPVAFNCLTVGANAKTPVEETQPPKMTEVPIQQLEQDIGNLFKEQGSKYIYHSNKNKPAALNSMKNTSDPVSDFVNDYLGNKTKQTNSAMAPSGRDKTDIIKSVKNMKERASKIASALGKKVKIGDIFEKKK